MKPKFIVPELIIVTCFATSAYAQVTIDFSKVTCEQFVFSKIAPSRTLSLWLSGYYSGKRNNPIVNVQAVQANAEKVTDFCRQTKNLKMPVMEAVEQVLGKKQ